MIHIDNMGFTWPNTHESCLHSINLHIKQGESIALMGDNGAGKSTLFKLLVGLLKPSTGSILIHGQNISQLNAAERALLIGLLFQEPERQFFHHTVFNEVAYGLKIRRMPTPLIHETTEKILEEFMLLHHKNSHPLDLNAAEKRLVTLASLAVLDQPVLLLDEPSRDLDDDWLALFEHWLANAQKKGTTIITISHDSAFIERNFEKVLTLSRGSF